MAFRLRIALLSLSLSGVLLVGFGAFFLATIQSVGLERVDREIRALAEGQLRGHHPAQRWETVERSIRFIYGETSSARLALKVLDTDGGKLFTSSATPEEIAVLAAPPLPFTREPSEGPPLSGDELLAMLDTDGDDRLSTEEFEGPPRAFQRYDLDGDGFLGRVETQRAAERRRPPRQKEPEFRTIKTSMGSWRVGFLGNEYVTLVVGVDLAEYARETSRFRRAFLIATPLALLGLAVAGWWLARRALRPVALLTRTAEQLTAGGLDQRVPVVAADRELRRLVDVINGMLARLERSFEQAVRFSSDAAHELQTPLTVLQGELDNAIQSAGDGSEEQQRLSSLLEEVRRLKAVVHKLLLLARADAGRLDLQREPVDLSDMLASAIEDVEVMAPEVTVEAAIAREVSVLADADLLNQVVLNMTTNAVKYGEPTGVIRFELVAEKEKARFTLSNSGELIPREDRERIFDRFYRLDASRDGRVGGSGLGLSLAREIARSHGGDLTLGPDQPRMTAFVLSLPRTPGSPATSGS